MRRKVSVMLLLGGAMGHSISLHCMGCFGPNGEMEDLVKMEDLFKMGLGVGEVVNPC